MHLGDALELDVTIVDKLDIQHTFVIIVRSAGTYKMRSELGGMWPGKPLVRLLVILVS